MLMKCPSGTLVDTAEVYEVRDGNGLKAESRIGDVLFDIARTSPDKKFYIATKFAPQLYRTGAKSVLTACRDSLKRLGVDQIDLYQIHYPDTVQPIKLVAGITHKKDEKYWDGLADAYHEGLISNVGVCNYGPSMVRKAHKALQDRGVPLVSNQINFNLMRYRSSMDTKLVCDQLGVRILGYHPLAKGALTGAYDLSRPDETMPESPSKRYRMRWYLKRNGPLVDALSEIMTARRADTCSGSKSMSMAQMAINWSMCKGVLPIVGAKDVAQLEENLGAIGWSLDEKEVGMLDQASDESCEFERGFMLE